MGKKSRIRKMLLKMMRKTVGVTLRRLIKIQKRERIVLGKRIFQLVL